MTRVACFALLAVALLALHARAEVESFDCRTAAGWMTTDFATGKPPAGASLGVEREKLVFRYRRATLSPLVHAALLTELRRLRLWVRSDKAVTLFIGLQDRDGAAFHHAAELPAGQWQEVSVTPAGFKLNDDSKVKKPALDARRLGFGYGLVDLGFAIGAGGENTLTVDRVEVERAPAKRSSGDLVVEGEVTVAESAVREGNILVKKGGRLRVTAPRFVLKGNLGCEGGTVEVAGGVLHLPQRFNHERGIALVAGSRFLLRGAIVYTGLPFGVGLKDGSSLDAEGTEFSGGMTCDVPEGCRVSLRKVATPGEFIVAPGAELSIADTSVIMLWLTLGPAARGQLSLPDGAQVERWASRSGFKIQLERAAHVLWGVISTSGSDCEVARTSLYAAGIHATGKTSLAFANLHNRRDLASWALPAADRKLHFSETRVGAWNYYAWGEARITLQRCTFGEALAAEQGQIEVRDSTCDGSGGYLGAEGKARLRLVNCKIACLVVAKDEGTVELENCEITGNVRAAGKGTVRLVRCRVSGQVEKDPGATLVRN